MKDRFKYIEDGSIPPKIEEMEPLDEDQKYPVLGRYDFAGTGPRPGMDGDRRLYQQAAILKTRGEQLSPVIKRIGWILLRLAIVLAVIYFILQGSTFDCVGSQVSIT